MLIEKARPVSRNSLTIVLAELPSLQQVEVEDIKRPVVLELRGPLPHLRIIKVKGVQQTSLVADAAVPLSVIQLLPDDSSLVPHTCIESHRLAVRNRELEARNFKLEERMRDLEQNNRRLEARLQQKN